MYELNGIKTICYTHGSIKKKGGPHKFTPILMESISEDSCFDSITSKKPEVLQIHMQNYRDIICMAWKCCLQRTCKAIPKVKDVKKVSGKLLVNVFSMYLYIISPLTLIQIPYKPVSTNSI